MSLQALAFCADNEAAIKEFGIERSKPIHSGFFFWNFKYVPAPYVIERRGLTILINGIIVKRGPTWPQFDYAVTVDPGPPPDGLSPLADTPSGKDPRNEYWPRKIRYLHSIHSTEKAIEILNDLIRQTKMFEKVEPGVLPDSVYVTKKDGKRVELGLNDSSKRTFRSADQLLSEQAGTMDRFKNYLTANAILSFNTGMEHIVTSDRASKAVIILADDNEVALKIKALIKIGVLDEADVQLHQLVNIFNRDELAKRMATTEKEKGGDTGSANTIPIAHSAPVLESAPAIATKGENISIRILQIALLICGFIALCYAGLVLRKRGERIK